LCAFGVLFSHYLRRSRSIYAAQEWFRFTKAAAGKTLSETYQLEEETA
jgi:hypothetical protein